MLERDLREIHDNVWYLSQYLKFGSVEEVYKANRWDLNISIAAYHRLVKKSGIVKSSGRREASLSESLAFFAKKALEPTVGLETLYHDFVPASFQTSLASLHRIYNRILNHEPVRNATALIVHPRQYSDQVLFGNEIFTNRRFGSHSGAISVPMCFSDKGESGFISVLRVLQRECFTDLAASGKFGIGSQEVFEIIPENIGPFAYFDILDVRVSLFEVSLPDYYLDKLSSYKLANHKFINISDREFIKQNLRLGVSEILDTFSLYKQSSETGKPVFVNSLINRELAPITF